MQASVNMFHIIELICQKLSNHLKHRKRESAGVTQMTNRGSQKKLAAEDRCSKGVHTWKSKLCIYLFLFFTVLRTLKKVAQLSL